MAINNTEKVGFANQFIQLMQDNSATLKTSGLDAANWITEVSEQRDGAVSEGGKQDDLQAATKAQTKKSNDAHNALYRSTSTKLDAVIGVLGKSSPEAKQAAKLRSSINKKSKPKNSSKP